MRKLKIYKPQELSDPNKHFQDAKTGNQIKCAFSLTEKCGPNCAACEIWGTGDKVTCLRMPNSEDITPIIGALDIG